MNFKKILLFIPILVLAGCKKNTEDAPYYFSASIKGKEYQFNIGLKGMVKTPNDTSAVRCVIIGQQGVLNDSALLSLRIENYSNESVTPGSYPRQNFILSIFYNDWYNFGLYSNEPNANNFILVLKEVASSYISGTFSGILFSNSDSVLITNGKFKAPLTP